MTRPSPAHTSLGIAASHLCFAPRCRSTSPSAGGSDAVLVPPNPSELGWLAHTRFASYFHQSTHLIHLILTNHLHRYSNQATRIAAHNLSETIRDLDRRHLRPRDRALRRVSPSMPLS